MTRSYDWLATGGCCGFHWSKEFSMKLIADGKEMAINFYDCDAPHQHKISKDFIVWTANPVTKLICSYAGGSFLLSGYDLQNLFDNIGKYMDFTAK